MRGIRPVRPRSIQVYCRLPGTVGVARVDDRRKMEGRVGPDVHVMGIRIEVIGGKADTEQVAEALLECRTEAVALVVLQRDDALVFEVIEADAVIPPFGAAGDAEVLVRD